MNKKQSSMRVDVIVYLRDHLLTAQESLEAVVKNSLDYNLIIINDRLSPETAAFAYDFSLKHHALLIENFDKFGFIRSINKAIRSTHASFVVVIDSSMIVSKYWLEDLISVSESEEKAGMVSPLIDKDLGQLLPDSNLEMMCAILDNALSAPLTIAWQPRPCFLIKRKLIESLGPFKEDAAMEEADALKDYDLRMQESGYYSKTVAGSCVKSANPAGIIPVRPLELAPIADQINHFLSSAPDFKNLRTKSALFILPTKSISGGANCVIEEIIALRECHFDFNVAVLEDYLDSFLYYYPQAKDFLCTYTEEGNELLDLAERFDIAIATNYTSVKHLKRMIEHCPALIPMYYIQDYEVWFFPRTDFKRTVEAARSYTLIPHMTCFAKTEWLCNVIKAWYDIDVVKVNPGLDKNLFTSNGYKLRHDVKTVRITAMIRPNSLVRNPRITLNVLRTIKKLYKKKVDIRIFGCSDEELDLINEAEGFEFVNVGELRRHQMAEFLRGCDIFLDASQYQALGCTGLEAMAVGCAVILPRNCGTSAYAVDMENSLLVDTENKENILKAVKRLVEDPQLLKQLKYEGINTAKRFSLRKSTWGQIELFSKTLSNQPMLSQ